MRVLHVVPTYFPATRYGGPIHSVHGLCAALVRVGHTVHVYTTSVDGPGDSEVPHDRPVALDGVQVSYFRSRRLRRLYWSPAMGAAFDADVGSFDLVHLHSVFLWPTSAAARAAARAGVPYVVSPRGMLGPDPIRAKSRLTKMVWLTWVESETLANAAAVHFTSERELRAARELPFPLPRPFVLPNGVDVGAPGFAERASPAVRALVADDYALFLGRVNWIKGLDRMIDALAGTPVRVLVCGPDDEGHRAELQARATRHGVASQVTFLGSVAGDDKWALLSRAQFLVLPSYSEGFGNVVVESLAAGRPVLVTDAVGAATTVQAAGGGVVTTGDVPALREGMLRLWQDREFADTLGRAGERYARDHLQGAAVARAMAARYRELVRSRSVGPVDGLGRP